MDITGANIDRWNSAIEWLNTNGYTIRHKFVVWNQGETDGDVNTTKANYTSQLTSIRLEQQSSCLNNNNEL